MIFAMTAASVQRCLQSNVLQGDVGVRVTDVVETWAHRHNAGFSLLDGSGGQIALSMPVPHGLLLTSRVWEGYCVPVLLNTKRARALGWHHCSGLLVDIAIHNFTSDFLGYEWQTNVSVSDPVVLQQSADYMRMLLAGTDGLGETQRGEIQDHMARLQAARDGLVQGLWRRSTQAFAVHTLIHALLLAGCFTSQEIMTEGVKIL